MIVLLEVSDIENDLNRIWIDFHLRYSYTESFSANFQEKLADEYYAQLRGNRHKTLGFFNNSGSKIMTSLRGSKGSAALNYISQISSSLPGFTTRSSRK